MKKIVVLSKQNPVNYNQFIHWNSKGSDQSDCGKDRKAIMSRDRLTSGNEVPCGVYRCNACAKQIDLQEDKTKLPQCSACGGFSWRTKRACKISDSTE
jgi:hypothetical protein